MATQAIVLNKICYLVQSFEFAKKEHLSQNT